MKNSKVKGLLGLLVLPVSSVKIREPGLPSSSRIAFASETPGISMLIRSLPSWYTTASVL